MGTILTFVADGATVGTAVYTVENRDIAEPLVPEKTGYYAEWENYTLTTGNVTVNAVYTPVVYTVTFAADGETVAECTYTVEDNTFAVPSVPNKVGYTGVWETYSLKTGDMTVNAVYTPIEYTVTFNIRCGRRNSRHSCLYRRKPRHSRASCP